MHKQIQTQWYTVQYMYGLEILKKLRHNITQTDPYDTHKSQTK